MKPLEDRLAQYEALLRKWQKSINLISPNSVDTIKERHIEDSLQLLPLIPQGVKTICDLGSGAGFPAIPIAMARPDIEVHCIESDHKKCTFLQIVSRETICDNLSVHCARIEDKLHMLQPDLLTARALASLDKLLAWGDATEALYLKGRTWRDEVAQAQKQFDFTLKTTASQSDPEAAILFLSDIRKA